MNETLNSLHIFHCVAKAKSFRAAAEQLKTSPATVSRRIAELESSLQAQLLVRTTREVYLTDVGEQLFDDTKASMQALFLATKKAANSHDEMAGLVRITATYTIAETVILPLIPQMHVEQPDIRLELMLDESVLDIRDKSIDFAVRVGKLTDPTLIARKIGTDRVSYFCAPSAGSNPPILSYGLPEFEPVPPKLVVKDMRMLLDLLKQGFGAAWLPEMLVAQAKNSGLVRDTNKPSFNFDGYIVYHANRYISRRTRYVMDNIINSQKRLAQDNK